MAGAGEYMIKVGADFSGVISSLKALDSQIAQTKSKAAGGTVAGSTTVARLPQQVTQAASVSQGQFTDVRELARQQAQVAMLARQTAEFNARKLGASYDDVLASRTVIAKGEGKGKDSQLEGARQEVIAQLKQWGLTTKQASEFTRAYNAEIAQQLARAETLGYNALISTPGKLPGNATRRFQAAVNPTIQEIAPGAPGVTTERLDRLQAGKVAGEEVISGLTQQQIENEAEILALQELEIATRKRRLALEQAAASSVRTPPGLDPQGQVRRPTPESRGGLVGPNTLPPPRTEIYQDPETGAMGPGASVLIAEAKAAELKAVTQNLDLTLRQVAANSNILASTLFLDTELDQQIAANARLTELTLRANVAALQRANALAIAAGKNPDLEAERVAQRQLTQAQSRRTDPNAPYRDLEAERNASRRRRREEARAYEDRARQFTRAADDLDSGALPNVDRPAADKAARDARKRAEREADAYQRQLDAEARREEGERRKAAATRPPERIQQQAEFRNRKNLAVQYPVTGVAKSGAAIPFDDEAQIIAAQKRMLRADLKNASTSEQRNLINAKLLQLDGQELALKSARRNFVNSRRDNQLIPEAPVLGPGRDEFRTARANLLEQQTKDRAEAARAAELRAQEERRVRNAARARGGEGPQLSPDAELRRQTLIAAREKLRQVQAISADPQTQAELLQYDLALKREKLQELQGQARTTATNQQRVQLQAEIAALEKAEKAAVARRVSQTTAGQQAVRDRVRTRETNKLTEADEQRIIAAERRLAASRGIGADDPALAREQYRQQSLARARVESERLRLEEGKAAVIAEAERRNAQRAANPITTAPVFSASTANLSGEAKIVATQLKLLEAEQIKLQAAQGGIKSTVEQKALDQQITVTKAEYKNLLAAQNAQLKVARGVGINSAGNAGGTGGTGPGGGGGGGGGNGRGSARSPFGGNGNAASFFGGGALAAVKYGLPSMLLYGGLSGITNTIKEAEQLEYSMSRLEGQFEAVFGAGADSSKLRGEILGIAKDTGLAANEIAELQIQITGAFNDEQIGNLSGKALINEQVQSAAKLAQTVSLPLAEITDGLTAASLNFGRSFEDIGDIALGLEERSGVLAKETVSFIGDIAPVAKEAGYSLEEFSALAAVAQQRSGRSGTALAESFGRVIPALSQSKDQLLALAAADTNLGTPEFVDAIRESDVKGIFQGIGNAYATMTEENKQLVVQLLGGRREAQAIIPAIANDALVKKYTDVADASEGTLEERFAKIQETLTNAAARFGEAIRQFGVELLDAGLADFFDTLISSGRLLLDITGPLIRAAGTINDIFGGWPAQILLATVAFRALRAVMTLEGGGIAGANFARGVTGSLLGSYGAGGPIAGFRAQYAANRAGLNAAPLTKAVPATAFTPVLPAQQGPTLPNRAPLNARQAGLRALGTTASSLAPYAGILALGAVYGKINSEIDKSNAELKELRDEIREGNEKLDFTDEDIRTDRIKFLTTRAEEESERVGGWFSSWNDLLVRLNVVSSKAEEYSAEAEAIENFDPKINEFYDNIDQVLLQAVSDLKRPRLGRGTGKFRSAIENATKFEYDENGNILNPNYQATRDSGGGVISNPFQTNLRADEQRFIEESARLAGVEVPELDPQIVQALLDPAGNPADLINQMAERQGDYSDLGAVAVDQAGAVREAFANAGLADSEINAAVKAMKEDAVPEIDRNRLNLDELKAAREAGVISSERYLEETSRALAERRRILAAGEETTANDIEILKVTQEQNEVWKSTAEFIRQDQERLASIARALGSSDADINAANVAAARANIANPNFRDKDALLEAAITITEAEANTALRIAYEAGNIEEVNRILADGVEVPAEAKQIFYSQQVFSTDAWKQLAEDLTAVEGAEVFNRKLPKSGQPVSEVFNGLGATPEDIANKAMTDFFTLGKLSEETSDSIATDVQKLMAQLSEGGITPELRANITGSIDGLVDLMAFAGKTRTDILNALIGGDFYGGDFTPEQRQAVLDQYNAATANGSIFPTPEEQRARVAAQDTQDLKNSEFEFRKAQANGDTIALANIEREAAAYEYQMAEQNAQGLSEPQRLAAMNAAAARMYKADQELISAVKSINDAKIGYAKAVAESTGNFAQAARLEVLQAEVDYQDAIARGDQAAAIAAQGQKLVAQRGVVESDLADRKSGFDLIQTQQEINGDNIGAARTALAAAQDAARNAVGVRGINEANAALAQAQDELNKSVQAERQSLFSFFAALAEFNGDLIGAARLQIQAAQEAINNARGLDEQIAAQQQLLAAKRQEQQAKDTTRNAAFALFKAVVAKDDPIAQLKIDLALAKEQLKDAKGEAAINDANVRIIEIQKELNNAMNDARYAKYNLRQAELDAMDEDGASARIAAQLARQQLSDAIARGAGSAEIDNLRAGVIAADRQARDAIFNEQMDDYKWLLDMGRITQGQYADYLKGLLSTLQPGTDQFKQLELTIKQLKDDIGSDLQANLPTSLSLPTLYEVRRLSQTPSTAGDGGFSGYQDNRNVQITINVDDSYDPNMLNAIADAVNGAGSNTNGFRTGRRI